MIACICYHHVFFNQRHFQSMAFILSNTANVKIIISNNCLKTIQHHDTANVQHKSVDYTRFNAFMLDFTCRFEIGLKVNFSTCIYHLSMHEDRIGVLCIIFNEIFHVFDKKPKSPDIPAHCVRQGRRVRKYPQLSTFFFATFQRVLS